MLSKNKICTDSSKRYLCEYILKLAVGFHEHATRTPENYLQYAMDNRSKLNLERGKFMLSGFEPNYPTYNNHSINAWFAPNYIKTTKECKITKEVIISRTSEFMDFGFSDVMFDYEQIDFIFSDDHIDFGDESGFFDTQ